MAKAESVMIGRPSGRIFYGWWIALMSGVSMGLISAPTWQGTGIFFKALENEFHWSRTVLSGAFAIARAEGAVMGPIEGFLADRVGARRTMCGGLVLAALGFFLFTQVNNPWVFYISFIMIAEGASLGGYIPIATTINHWFNRRRTTAMSFPMIGSSLGGILVPLLAWSTIAFGWRTTAAGIGVCFLLFTVPILRFMRDRPEQYGLTRDGDPPSASPPPVAEAGSSAPADFGFTARQAIRTRAFWGIAFAHAGTGILVSTLGIHLIPHLTDEGFSLPLAAVVVLVFTVTSGPFQVVGGWLGDRVEKRYVICGFMLLQGIATLLLLVVHSLPMALVYAVIGGIGQGGRAPAMTTIRGDYFGRRSFGTILGISMMPMNVGMIIMPFLAGFLYDRMENYNITFLVLAALVTSGGLLILFVRPPRPPVSVPQAGPA